MPEEGAEYIFDVRGMLLWSQATGNEFAVAKTDVESGAVCLFSIVFNEFAKVYDDKAVIFKGLKVKKKSFSPEHREATVAIAEKAQATFGFKGPYDKAIEWQVAGIACCENYTVVTDAKGKVLYSKIDGIEAITFDEFMDRHEN